MMTKGTVESIHKSSADLHVYLVKLASGGFAKVHGAPGTWKDGDTMDVTFGTGAAEKKAK